MEPKQSQTYMQRDLEDIIKKDSLILIVEDDEVQRKQLVRSFRTEGYTAGNLLQASTEKQALQMLEEHHDRLDLVLCDINLPSESDSSTAGERVMEKANDLGLILTGKVKFVLYTGYEDWQRGIQLRRLGAHDYFAKAIDDIDIVMARIRGLLTENAYRKKYDTVLELFDYIQQMTKGVASKRLTLESLADLVGNYSWPVMNANLAVMVMPRDPFQDRANGDMVAKYVHPPQEAIPAGSLDSSEGLLARIISRRSEAVIEDLESYDGDVERFFWDIGARSVIGVPLIYGTEARGAFFIVRKDDKERVFNQDNLVFMRGMRDALTIGLDNLNNFYVNLFATESILAELIDTLEFVGLPTAGGDTKDHVYRQKEKAKEIAYLLQKAQDDPDMYGLSPGERREEFNLSLEGLYVIEWTSGMSDCGKSKVARPILNKNGPLTPEEYQTMQKHPILGYRIIMNKSNQKMLPPDHIYRSIAEAVKHHHERWDGRTDVSRFPSYPGEKSGVDIPLASRVAFLADTYDAMVSERVYKKPKPIGIVIDEFTSNIGAQFDPVISRIFIQHLLGDWLRRDYINPEGVKLDPNYDNIDRLIQDKMTPYLSGA